MQHRQVTYSSRPNHRARVVHAQGERQFRTYDTSHIRPRKSRGPVIFAAILAILVVVGLGFGVVTMMKGCSGNETDGTQIVVTNDITVKIPDGSTAADAAKLLEAAGVVPEAKLLLTHAQDLGVDSQFKAGTYTFTSGMTLDQVVQSLVDGPVHEGNLTIPEGYTVDQVAASVEKATNGKVTAKDFTKAAHNAKAYAKDYPFVADAYDNSLEGFLFPKTYKVTDKSTADAIVRMMLDQYQTEVNELGLTYDQLIIAAMIEREAQLDKERPLVASVIYNRLEADMPLGIDATTAYVYGTDFTADQLHEEGPYNTYDQKGLPAGPICSPGMTSLEAAVNPSNTDYLYYVTSAKGDGSHVFAKTYEEHQANIEKLK